MARAAASQPRVASSGDQIAASFGAETEPACSGSPKLVGGASRTSIIYGLPVQAAFTRAAERLRAQAPRIRQLGARSIQLLEVDVDESPWNELGASDRTPQLTRIWATSGEDDALLVDVRSARSTSTAGDRTVIVDTLTRMTRISTQCCRSPAAQSRPRSPARLSPARAIRRRAWATALRFGGGGALPAIATHARGKPWLLVDDVRRFEMDDQQQGHVEGAGYKLLISQGSAATLFLGDPDAQTPAVVRRNQDGRDVVVRGAGRPQRGDLQPSALARSKTAPRCPTMTLREAGGGLLAHMEAVCRGDIHTT